MNVTVAFFDRSLPQKVSVAKGDKHLQGTSFGDLQDTCLVISSQFKRAARVKLRWLFCAILAHIGVSHQHNTKNGIGAPRTARLAG